MKISLSRGRFGLCVDPRGLISTRFDRIARAERDSQPVLVLKIRPPGRDPVAEPECAAARVQVNPGA